MRILFGTRDYPPTGMAGTEVYTSTLANGLYAAGNEVSVTCVGQWDTGIHPFNGYSVDEYQGVPVTRVNLNWLKAPDPSRYLYDNPRVADFWGRHLRKVNPDVVHVTSCDRLSASIVAVAKQMGFPVVLSLTDFWFLCPRTNLVRSDGSLCNGQTTPWTCLRCMLEGTKFLKAITLAFPEELVEPVVTWTSKRSSITRHRGLRGLATDMVERKRYLQDALCQANHVMIATEFGRRLFQSVLPDKEIHIVQYGHDLESLANYSGKTDSGSLRIGFIGRLDEPKGPHILIDAFKQLPKDHPTTLSIFGRVPQNGYGTRLQFMAQSDPRIQFCGGYSHDESARIYANLDVLVIPSLWYDFPLVAHEAIATGTMVIATNIPGLNEIVTDGVTGLLFERGNVSDLAEKLKYVLGSPESKRRLSSNARPVKGTKQAVEEMIAIYGEILAGRS